MSHENTTAHVPPAPGSFPPGSSSLLPLPGFFAPLRRSPLMRFLFMGVLVLLLQIPVGLIAHAIDERRATRAEAINELTATWGGAQEVIGPMLTVPAIERWTDTDHVARERTVFRHFLPQTVSIEGRAPTEVRRRGIFDVPLYVATLEITGTFVIPGDTAFNSAAADILWKRASLSLGIADPRAIRAASSLMWGASELALEPGPGDAGSLPAGVHVTLPQETLKPGQTVPFTLELTLGGSGRLSLVPVGAETRARLSSPWPDPSFDGSYLPRQRQVNARGFVADWHVLHLGRNFPATWVDTDVSHERLRESAFGVSLLSPVDAYRTSERAVKYQLLFLGLTFLAFTLMEMLGGLCIHPIQYLLVGLALCLFYLLLLSLSEHLGFGRAYAIAGLTVTGLVTGYVRVLLRTRTQTATIATLLSVLYGFLFVLLQIQDYALLVGSLGLLAVLAGIMALTRKVNWYAM